MTLSQIEIASKALELAGELGRGAHAVKRNTFLSIVAAFMSEGDLGRFGRLLDLVASRSGGHLLRTGGCAEQAERAVEVLRRVLAERALSPEEARSLFGWTARLLLIQGGEPPSGQGEGGAVADQGKQAVAGASAERRTGGSKKPSRGDASQRGAGAKGLGAVKAKTLGDLGKLKETLSQREKGEES